jgi:phosphonate transport system substrate-binding protein
MTFNITVSPDFSPDHIAGWYIFNTWLQRKMGFGVHLELYDDFASQRLAIAEDKVDIIFANPYDAAMLVREKGFTAIATAKGERDEVVIAASVDSPINCVEDLKAGARVSLTPDPDVELIGKIMLEPANLNKDNIVLQQVASYVLVAKQLIQGKADVGFFLKDAYGDLSGLIRKSLRVLVTSEIHVVRHVLLVGPRFTEVEPLRQVLLAMNNDLPQGPSVLDSLGFSGWESQSEEDTEFMIDLMNTLQD